MSAAPLHPSTLIRPTDLETRVANRKRELIFEIEEHRRNLSRPGAAVAVELIRARLSELARIVKESVVDGWANVSPSATLKLDKWITE